MPHCTAVCHSISQFLHHQQQQQEEEENGEDAETDN